MSLRLNIMLDSLSPPFLRTKSRYSIVSSPFCKCFDSCLVDIGKIRALDVEAKLIEGQLREAIF